MTEELILTENDLFQITLKDEVKSSDLIDLIRCIRHNTHYPRDFVLLIDAHAGKAAMNPSDLISIIQENKLMVQQYNSVKVAIVISTIVGHALSLVYQQLSHPENYLFSVFSNYSKAKEWLLSESD